MYRERLLVCLVGTLAVFVTCQPSQAARSGAHGRGEEAATASSPANSSTPSPDGASGGGGGVNGGLWVAIALVLATVLILSMLLVTTVLVCISRLSRRRRPQYLGNCRNLDPAHREGTISLSTLRREQAQNEEAVTSFTASSHDVNYTAWPQLHSEQPREKGEAATMREDEEEEGQEYWESTFETDQSTHSSMGRTYTFPDGAGPKLNIRQGISRQDSGTQDNNAENDNEQNSSNEYCVLGSGPYSTPGSEQPERSEGSPARDRHPSSPVYMGLSPITRNTEDLEAGGYQTIERGKGPPHVPSTPRKKRPPPRLLTWQKKGGRSVTDPVPVPLPSSGYQGLTASTRDPPSIYMKSTLHKAERSSVEDYNSV